MPRPAITALHRANDDPDPARQRRGPDHLRELPQRLETVRKLLRLKDKRDVARELGVAPTTYASWASGGRRPDADMLIEIADKLGLNLAWLLRGIGKPFAPNLPDPYVSLQFAQRIGWEEILDAPGIVSRHDGPSIPKRHSSGTLFALTYERRDMAIKIPPGATAIFDYEDLLPAPNRVFLIYRDDFGTDVPSRALVRHYTDQGGVARWEPQTYEAGHIVPMASPTIRVLGRLVEAKMSF